MDQRLLATEEAPRFDTITDDAFDSLAFSSRPSITKLALQDPFAVAVDPFFKTSKSVPKDTSSYAIDLEGFERRAFKKAYLASAANGRGGALRRSSSFNNIDTLRFSTGDDPFAGFDSMPFEMPTLQRAKTTEIAESSHKSKSSPDAKNSTDRRRTHRSPTRGVGRSRSREDDVLPSSSSRKTSHNHERSRPRSPKRNHTADSCLLHKTSSREDTKHSHSKSVTIDGSSRPRTKGGSKSKSPIRTSSSRRGDEKKSARDRLNMSAGSIVSESSANTRLNRSAGSLNSKTKNERLSMSSNELDHIQENEPMGPLAKAMANIKARDDLDIHDTPRKAPSSTSKHESSSSKSKHDSFSSKSKLMKDDSSGRSRDRRHISSSRSASRSASRGGESDRSRSNSRSRHHKTASVSAASRLLSGAIDDSNHDDHMLPAGHKSGTEKDSKNKFNFASKHRSTDSSDHPISTKSSRSRGVGRSRSENKHPARGRDETEDPAETKSRHTPNRSRSENKHPTRHRGRTGSVEARDRHRARSGSANKHPTRNRGRSGSGGPKRSRRTGSVEMPRNRSGSVDAKSHRGRRTHSVDAKAHRRTGSVEAKSRRTEATARDEPGLRRAATGGEEARSRHTRNGQSGPAFGRSNTTGTVAEEEGEEKEKEVFLPSISGLTGGEVPKWKVPSKAKAQPGDGDAGHKANMKAQKARRLTQAEYGIKIGKAKNSR